jgi:iron(III) transport system substrate-binding protein
MNRLLKKSGSTVFIALLSGLIGLAGLLPAVSHAQKVSNRDIYMYQGADRDEKLLANAKKEGSLSLYTVLNISEYAPLLDAFTKKYGIKINMWRGSGEQLVQRALGEAKANRYNVDVVELGTGIDMLYRENLLEEFYSPNFKDIPPEALPKHRHFAPDSLFFYVIAYNTNLVKPDQVPNSYADLLLPRWRGSIGMDPGDIDWFGSMLKSMGQEKGMEYFRQLAAQKPQMRSGHTLMATLIAAGEIPITPIAFNYTVEQLKQKGAPIAWKALPLTIARTQSIGLTKNAPHPNAALLFADYILSKEGQQIIKQLGTVPSSMAVDTPLKDFKYELMDPALVVDNWDKWNTTWTNMFLGKAETAKK